MYTRREIHIYDWVELTIDYELLKRVEELEKNQKQSTFDKYNCFEWAPGISIWNNTTGNEDEGYDRGNPEDKLLEEIVEVIYE